MDFAIGLWLAATTSATIICAVNWHLTLVALRRAVRRHHQRVAEMIALCEALEQHNVKVTIDSANQKIVLSNMVPNEEFLAAQEERGRNTIQ